MKAFALKGQVGVRHRRGVSIAALRADGKISKVRTIQTAGGAGIWADIKRRLCVGFSAVLRWKNVNPVSVGVRIINSRTSERSTTNKQKEGWGARRINSSDISSDFRMRWWNTGGLCPQLQQLNPSSVFFTVTVWRTHNLTYKVKGSHYID